MSSLSLSGRLRRILVGSSNYAATVDVAKAAPPPSPLAPVDLTSEAQVTGVMEIAARIGEILIGAGTANADVRAQVYLAAASYGLHYLHVDVLTNTITLHTSIGTGDNRRSLHVFRVAPGIDVNFSKLSAVDRLIRSIHSGSTPPAMAERILDELENTPPPRKLPLTLVGWGVMGSMFAFMLGGGWATAVITFFVASLIMGTNSKLSDLRVPAFYQNMVGGFIAVVPAAILYNLGATYGIAFTPSQIIGSGIIVLVAGLTLVQALIDGITRAPVTSAARFFEAMLSTAALVAGVALGIQVAAYLGFSLPPLGTVAPPVYFAIPFRIVCGGIGCAAFAYACYASRKESIISGFTAAAGMIFFYSVIVFLGMGTVATCLLSAIVVGLAGGLMSRRFHMPPLITMITGYTPMLPGLTFYRAMYATTNDQIITGLSNLLTALAIAGALASGVVLGERVARRLRRPQHFRPYKTFKRLGRKSYQGATRLAAGARKIPRVPMSPHAPKVNRPVPPPVLGPKPPAPAKHVRLLQDQVVTEQFAALSPGQDFDLEATLNKLDPVFDDDTDADADS